MLYVDNTMLSDAKACMRYYYFRHHRHWVTEGFDAAKAFGTAWHSAMDALWAGKDAGIAYEVFLASWKDAGGPWPIMPIQRPALGARTPETAELMIRSYARDNKRLIERNEVLHTEYVMQFPLMEGVTYVGCIDKVLRDGSDGLCLLEHKTTSWGTQYGFNEAWIRAFDLSSQVSGYLYGASQIWPDKKVRLLIDAALVHKTARKFQMWGQSRTQYELEEWLFTAREKADQIQAGHTALPFGRGNPWLSAFPKETDSCIRFMKLCPYFGTCKAVPNPEAVGMPIGFKEERWAPQERVA